MQAIFLDIETTGLNPQIHHPLEIAFVIMDVSTHEIISKYQSVIALHAEQWNMRDPSSIKVNHFTWQEVEKGKPVEQVREEIISIFNKVPIKRGRTVFLCQNPSFDRGFFNLIVDVYIQEGFVWPYHWLDLASMFWTYMYYHTERQGIPFPQELNISKNGIAHYFGLAEENSPHRAMQGVDHLIACYKKIFTSDKSLKGQVPFPG